MRQDVWHPEPEGHRELPTATSLRAVFNTYRAQPERVVTKRVSQSERSRHGQAIGARIAGLSDDQTGAAGL